jgi:rubrerythrin
MHPTTRSHLEDALRGEAFAALRYALFADRAEEEGREDIADLFEQIGKEERKEHFREIADLLDLVGTTEQNIRVALSGEIQEHRSFYPRYAADARQVGDLRAAGQFQELGADEHRHADRLERARHEVQLAPVG